MQSLSLHRGGCHCRSLVALALFAWAGALHAGDAQTLIAGGDFSYPPYEYLDNQGNPQGFNVALLRAIARDRNLDIRFELGPWKQRRQLLENAAIHVMPMFISEYRDQHVDFTQPFLIVNHELFVRKDDVTPNGLEDLTGLRVIVETDAYAHDYMKLHGRAAELLLVESEAAAMRLLAAGKGDVAILGELRGRHMLDEEGLDTVTTSGPPVLPVPYAFAVPEGRDRLREQLNAGLASVKASGEFNRIYSRWLAFENNRMLRLAAWVAGIALIAALLALAWNHSLRRQVGQRTRALSESEQRFRATFEHAAIGMAWLGPGGNWIAANAALCRMMEAEADTLPRLSVRRVLSREHVRTCIRKARELHAGRQASFAVEMPFHRASGQAGWASVHVSLLKDHSGARLGYIAVVEDVTEMRRLSEQLSYHRTRDALTGLLNRQEFENSLQAVLDAGDTDDSHVLCYLDLDRFRLINDACGHAAGDDLLRRIGAQLSGLIRAGDLLARIGPDEFAVLLRQCTRERGVQMAEGLCEAIGGQDFESGGQRFHVSASIGVAPVNSVNDAFGGFLNAANTACYVAREAGGNRIHVFEDGDGEMTRRLGEVHLVSRLKTAIDDNRLVLYRQDIAPLQFADGRHHYEVLLRLRESSGRLVMPGSFLPAAERYFLAEAMDRWVVENVLAWLAARPEEIRQLAMCAINLSGQSVGDPAFHRFLENMLDRHDIPPEKLCFEITETAAVGNIGRAVEFARKLKQRGCWFALDDFGIGMSSFAYLKSLPVDFLKIDGMFIREMTGNPLDKAIVRSIASVGHALDKRTIAEYVENREILETVRALGIDYAQGFAIARPRPLMADEQPVRRQADVV